MSDTIATDLWKALLDAQRSVANVARGGTNSSQNYKFATAEDVMLEARARLHERDLLLTFSEANHKIRETQRADKRTGEIIPGATVATVELDGCLIHAASGQQYTFTVSGEGADYGDKALPKAYTNAVKYGCRHLLLTLSEQHPLAQRRQAATHELGVVHGHEALVHLSGGQSLPRQIAHVRQQRRLLEFDLLPAFSPFVAKGVQLRRNNIFRDRIQPTHPLNL